jgi:Flp pilus assembly protein TadD
VERNPTEWRAWSGLANTYKTKGDFGTSSAINFYKRWSEKNPRDRFAWEHLYKAYRAKGDNNAAIQTYVRWTQKMPASWIAWNSLGRAYLMTEDFDSAIEACKMAVEIDPMARIGLTGIHCKRRSQ